MIDNISVHINNREQRKRKIIRDHLINDAKKLASNSVVSERISGYAIIAFTDDHIFDAAWKSGCIPPDLIPECFKQAVIGKIRGIQVDNKLRRNGLIDE